MSEPISKNITWHGSEVSQAQRESLINQKGCVLWFTGLSGSGKSTVARRVEQKLLSRGLYAYGLDGDNVRMGLNKDLGFSADDRAENIRRIGAVSQLFADSGAITLASFISPYRASRLAVRELVGEGRFIEVHVATSLAACEARDPKGLYKRARAGLIPNFTGISAPYEEPENPEIKLTTEDRTIDACADEIVQFLEERFF